MNHKTLIVPDTLDQINHNDDDDSDKAAAKMVTVMTTAAMAAVVAMMMEMTVASVRVVAVSMVKVVACSSCDGVEVVTIEMMLVAVVRRWRRWRWWRMRACGDGDGVSVIDQPVAWLSAVVTGTVLRLEAQGEVFVDGLGLAKKVWIFLSDLIFTDCNVLSQSGCSFESDLAVYDFDGFFDEMKLLVNLNFISRNGKGFVG
ncbi:hypothetical protein Tco_0682824 [Tanacetum coccineum]|uniref:Uncharacterized protein n=1 Tax=Tanacetum coccineum TaxID=301880 RepID=A0ABQ4XSA6_9ASTR